MPRMEVQAISHSKGRILCIEIHGGIGTSWLGRWIMGRQAEADVFCKG